MTALQVMHDNALRVLYSSMNDIALTKSGRKQHPIKVVSADFSESSMWIRFCLEKDNMPGFVFEQDFYYRDIEDYCVKHHDFDGLLFESWWSNLEWYDKQIICEAYVKRQGIGTEMNEAYLAWKKKNIIS